MYSVPENFQNSIRADERRIYGHAVINFTDPLMDQSIRAAANEKANVSYPDQTTDALIEPTYKYASLDGSTVLDGTYHPAPSPAEAVTVQMGWWGKTLASAPDATFAAPHPTLAVTHFPRPVNGFSISGDSKRQEWPVDFTIKLYGKGDVLLHTETVVGNTKIHWKKPLATPVTGVVKQELSITKWSHQGRQAKILEFFTSVQQIYEPDDLVEISLLEEREVGMGTIPLGAISANEITIRLRNDDRRYDADSVGSPFHQLLKPNQKIQPWLGIDSATPPVFTRNSVAYLFDGTQVAVNQPRFEQGKFGQALMVEEGTTNICNSLHIYKNTWTIIDHSLTRVTTISCSAGAVFSISADVRNPSPGNTRWAHIVFKDAVGTTLASHDALIDTGKIRQQYTSPAAPANTASADIYWVSTASGATYEGRNFQIEQKTYATTFIDGTRSPETLTISTKGVLLAAEGTIEGWIRFPKSSGHDGELTIFRADTGTPWTYRVLRYFPNLGRLQYTAHDGNLSKSVSIDGLTWHTDNLWHYFAVRWIGATALLTADQATVLGETHDSLTWDDTLFIGTAPDASNPANALFDDLRISNRARTDEEVAAIYTRGTPSPIDGGTTYKLAFDNNIQPTGRAWVPLGTFWSTEWHAPADSVVATVTGRDRLELLRRSTFSASQAFQNKTLHDLAVIVLQDAGLTAADYDIDAALQNTVIPWAWLEPTSHREAIRIIAEAAMAVAYADRDGKIRITPLAASGTVPVLKIDPDQYFRADNPLRYDEIANEVIVETHPLRPVAVAQEVYRSNEPVTVLAGQTVSLTVHYNERPVIDAVVALEGAISTVVQSITYYGWGADVTLHNPSTTNENVIVVINGRPFKVQNRERVVARDENSIADLGVLRYELTNPLVQTTTVAQQLANLILSITSNPRRDVEIDWRGNPALELGDRITSKGGDFVVIRNELNWAGALRARLVGRRLS